MSKLSRKYKKEERIAWIIVVLLIIVTAFLLLKLGEQNRVEANKRHCAVLGYEEDCKTLLPADRRLK